MLVRYHFHDGQLEAESSAIYPPAAFAIRWLFAYFSANSCSARAQSPVCQFLRAGSEPIFLSDS